MSELQRIEALGISEARQEWGRVFGASAPVGFNTDLIRRAIANHIQLQKQGGLSKRHARDLAARVEAHRLGSPEAIRMAKPGTRLARVWHGTTHHVTILAEGFFDYRGERYGSLSAIARKITGAGWSGPRFFGLTAKGNRNA